MREGAQGQEPSGDPLYAIAPPRLQRPGEERGNPCTWNHALAAGPGDASVARRGTANPSSEGAAFQRSQGCEAVEAPPRCRRPSHAIPRNAEPLGPQCGLRTIL